MELKEMSKICTDRFGEAKRRLAMMVAGVTSDSRAGLFPCQCRDVSQNKRALKYDYEVAAVVVAPREKTRACLRGLALGALSAPA